MLFLKTAYAQRNSEVYAERFNQIIELLKSRDYYAAIKNIDQFLIDYPSHAGMYFNRGMAKFYLNDYYAARQDLMKAKKLGVLDRDKIINQIVNKKYLVDILSESYLTDVKLDSARGFKPVFTLKDSLRGSLRPERTCFDVYFYNLTIKVFPKTKRIEGNNEIYFKILDKTKKIQIDLAQNFQIHSISWKGKELKYKRSYDAIFIDFDEELQAGGNQMITISYSGNPRIAPKPPWNGGFVWKKKRGKLWIGVACEHLGSSSWWPSKDHLSDKPDSLNINIVSPKGCKAIANGNLRSVTDIDPKYSRYEWHVSYPINSYNVTFYIGNFVNFNDSITNANGSYPIDYYVLPHHLKKAKIYYSKTKDIVNAYEKLFGEYPYKKDGLAMVEAPYAGMEHQSAIAIGDEYGEKKRRTYENTDYDYMVVHETAHEWWGNTIAMGDMADAWLSEAFATYAEHLFMEEKFGYPQYISASAKTMQMIFNIWPIVGIRDVNDNTFLGGDIYHKGAAMLNNLRCILNNDSLFFGLIKGFYNNYKYKVVLTSDFVNYVNKFTGNDYSDFFNKFLYDTEPPILKYSYTLKDSKLAFTYEWINVGKNFSMPFSITINDDQNIRLVGTTKQQTYEVSYVKTFYLPQERRVDKDKITHNSFTYYWTSWVH
jgi:aminopeptidase N